MTLVSLAIDYKKAKAKVRSAFSLEGELLPRYLDGLNAQSGVMQSVILSTCNRTELYVVLKELRDLDHVINWWQNQSKLENYDLKPFLVVRQETHVAHHLMRLASGLESMVLGEPQILGQIKHAYQVAMHAGVVGGELNRLFQKVFSVAKAVRYKTDIGQCPVSVAFSALSLAKQNFSDFSDKKILVVGAGDTASLVVRHLGALNPKAIFVANRTIQKAEILADKHYISAHGLDAISRLAKEADIIVTAVNSAKTFINKEMLAGKSALCMVIDLSVPQVISDELDVLEHVVSYCVDDVAGMIQSNQLLREKAAIYAEKWIEKGLDEYISQEKAISSDNLIIAMRQQSKEIVDSELKRSLKRLENGEDPRLVLARFAHNINNKWMHTPSVSVRNAAIEGREDVLGYAKEIFGLEIGKK